MYSYCANTVENYVGLQSCCDKELIVLPHVSQDSIILAIAQWKGRVEFAIQENGGLLSIPPDTEFIYSKVPLFNIQNISSFLCNESDRQNERCFCTYFSMLYIQIHRLVRFYHSFSFAPPGTMV